MRNPRPVHLLAGGRTSTRESLCRLIQRVYKDNEVTLPTIAYIGTANGDDESFFQRIAESLRVAGAGDVIHTLLSFNESDPEKAKRILSSADLVYVSGGDVFEGMKSLERKNMVGFLQRLYREGKPFFGLSAGSIILAEKWVQWNDPNDDSTAILFPCLNIAKVLCDTHGEQDSWNELKIALSLSEDGKKGYGIASGAAIIVHPDCRVEAFGGAVNQFLRNENEIIQLPDLPPIS
jgi:peptidase E